MTRYERGAEKDWTHHIFDFSKRLTVWIDAAGVNPKELRREFEAANYERLWLRISHTASVPDLEFLDQVDGIKELDILGPVQDDTYAFRRTDLRSLLLLTRSRRRIPDTDLGHLEKLAINNRPHHEQIHDLPRLKWLALLGWKSASLTFLRDMPRLEYLRIEARKVLISLDGLERCPSLREIWLDRARVDSLEPLRHLPLTQLWILGDHRMTDTTALDLAPLRGMSDLRDLRITNGGAVTSTRPLLELSKLDWLRLRGTQILDGDLSPLATLANNGVRVGGTDD